MAVLSRHYLALVSISARDTEGGTARVIAKQARSIGGKHVDQWLLSDLSKTLGYELEDDAGDEGARFWRQFMLAEARRDSVAGAELVEAFKRTLVESIEVCAIDYRALNIADGVQHGSGELHLPLPHLSSRMRTCIQ